MPRAKPLLLHGPHHPPTALSPLIASAVYTWPALGSVYAFFHSEPLRMAKPLLCTHRLLPPASHSCTFVAFPTNGAMKRAFTSGGPILYVVDWLRSRNAFG